VKFSTQSIEQARGDSTPQSRPVNPKLTIEFRCKNLSCYALNNIYDIKNGPQVVYSRKNQTGFTVQKGIFRIEPPKEADEPLQKNYNFYEVEDSEFNFSVLKLSLIPRAKEFIRRQESYGNVIELAKNTPKFIYVH
jgi:hypothetical protein